MSTCKKKSANGAKKDRHKKKARKKSKSKRNNLGEPPKHDVTGGDWFLWDHEEERGAKKKTGVSKLKKREDREINAHRSNLRNEETEGLRSLNDKNSYKWYQNWKKGRGSPHQGRRFTDGRSGPLLQYEEGVETPV